MPPALERESGHPLHAVAPESLTTPAPPPPDEIALMDQAVLVAVEDHRGPLDQRLQIGAAYLDRDSPPHALMLVLEPELDPLTVEGCAFRPLLEPQQATRDRVMLLDSGYTTDAQRNHSPLGRAPGAGDSAGPFLCDRCSLSGAQT